MSNRQLSAAAKHVLAARALVAQGWIQGAARNRHGVCMLGALAHADSDDTYLLACNAVTTALREKGWLCSIPSFNDHETTRVKDVLAVFDRAAQLA